MQNLQIEFIVDSEPVDQVSLQISDDQLQTLKQGIQQQASPKKRRGRPPAKKKTPIPDDNNLTKDDFEKPYQKEYDAQIRKEFKKANFDQNTPSGLASAKNLDEHSSDEDDDEIDNKSDDDEFLKGLEKQQEKRKEVEEGQGVDMDKLTRRQRMTLI